MKRITITGNIGQDPKLRTDHSGNEFVTFTVAINVGSKNNPKADWCQVSCEGKLADIIIKYAKKGTKVLVEGFPQVNIYTNKDNIQVGALRIHAKSVELLSRVGELNDMDLISTDDKNLHVEWI